LRNTAGDNVPKEEGSDMHKPAVLGRFAVVIVLATASLAGCGGSKQACRAETNADGEVLESELLGSVCEWEQDLPAAAVPGARIFISSGCTTCHTYRGVGSRNVGGSDLTAAGLRHSRRFFERFVADPSRFSNDVMPKYAFPPRQLSALALFLAASKGGH
jgi:hypothetical protein